MNPKKGKYVSRAVRQKILDGVNREAVLRAGQLDGEISGSELISENCVKTESVIGNNEDKFYTDGANTGVANKEEENGNRATIEQALILAGVV